MFQANFSVRDFQIYSLVICLVAQAVAIYASVALSDGYFVYTLDDPYIHLAVAESILRGEYGINHGEFASPSSSILYPFLLAVGVFAGLGTYSALLIGVFSSLASVWLLTGFVWSRVESTPSRWQFSAILIGGPALILTVSAIALPLTGMEHSLHILAVIMSLTGFYMIANGEGAWIRFAAGVLICALIRFEGLALSGALLIALFMIGYRRASLIIFLIVLGILGLYGFCADMFGLPILPSSVLTKSNIAIGTYDSGVGAIISVLIRNAVISLGNRWGMAFAMTALALIYISISRTSSRLASRLLLVVIALTLAAHMGAGQYGWFGRYETYAVTAAVIGLILIPENKISYQATTFLMSGVALFAMPYFVTALQTPAASRNIFEQQYQMGRFVREEFRKPVAVNDLGLVSYQNNSYVLDLWGLGSEEARQIHQDGGYNAERLREITGRHDIVYAMIYDEWFPETPREWCRIAELVTSRVTSASDTVAFYLIHDEQENEMRRALEGMRSRLPAGSRLLTYGCGGNSP